MTASNVAQGEGSGDAQGGFEWRSKEQPGRIFPRRSSLEEFSEGDGRGSVHGSTGSAGNTVEKARDPPMAQREVTMVTESAVGSYAETVVETRMARG